MVTTANGTQLEGEGEDGGGSGARRVRVEPRLTTVGRLRVFAG